MVLRRVSFGLSVLQDADGNPVTLEDGKPFPMTVDERLPHEPPLLTKSGEGKDAVSAMRRSSPNGSNGLVAVTPVY